MIDKDSSSGVQTSPNGHLPLQIRWLTVLEIQFPHNPNLHSMTALLIFFTYICMHLEKSSDGPTLVQVM